MLSGYGRTDVSADRELLEFAAKAAGIRLNISDGAGDERYLWITDAVTGKNWDPLTDDGDALRLAVKLRLEFEWWKNGVSVNRTDSQQMPIEHVGDDPYAATRRAIVRAAAEIGKAMP